MRIRIKKSILEKINEEIERIEDNDKEVEAIVLTYREAHMVYDELITFNHTNSFELFKDQIRRGRFQLYGYKLEIE